MLTLVGLSTSFVARSPVTTTMLYFSIGIVLGPYALQVFDFSLIDDAKFFERLTELVVIVSLFSAALKLRFPLRNPLWWIPVRLAFLSMILTVGMITLIAHYVLGLPWGAGVLLGAILAPTDPVLASEIQVAHSKDRDGVRAGLTGEAGLNDGTAFPFVMLGLGLLGLHPLGESWSTWIAIDVVWAVVGGIGIGWLCGLLVSRGILWLRRKDEETAILDEFLTLGLIALAYGAALAFHAYGFLAVFAAGFAIRKIEEDKQNIPTSTTHDHNTTIPKAVLSFTEQLERLGEVVTVLILGSMFHAKAIANTDLLIIPVLLLFVRPVAVWMGLAGVKLDAYQKTVISWFGIRGIGSLYYLTFVIGKELPPELSARLEPIIYFTVVFSVLLHGITVGPIMSMYKQHQKSRAQVR